MSERQKDDLTREERRAFGSLAANVSASSDMEDRVVAALRERGLVQRVSWWQRALASVPRTPRLAVGITALVVAFVAGVEYGKRSDATAIPEVRLEPEDVPGAPEVTEPAEDATGTVMASSDEASDERLYAGLEKPQLATLDEGHGDFPPYPLDGRERAISPKYR